ncbi:MAG: FHA domain-containing protein, partial [Prevotella sp.]|nr:FHA domain-containing protein [Prevotella sp.]
MKTIILGKEKPAVFDPQKGEVYQPFSYKVSQTGISRKHAIIIIDDNGCWWLEDRWST